MIPQFFYLSSSLHFLSKSTYFVTKYNIFDINKIKKLQNYYHIFFLILFITKIDVFDLKLTKYINYF